MVFIPFILFYTFTEVGHDYKTTLGAIKIGAGGQPNWRKEVQKTVCVRLIQKHQQHKHDELLFEIMNIWNSYIWTAEGRNKCEEDPRSY